MLLIVHYSLSLASSGAPVNYKAYLLDMSTEPATWVEVVKLENDALFMGRDVRSPTFSCMSPGRWGGRSNCLCYAHDRQPWVLHGLGDDADAVLGDSTDPPWPWVLQGLVRRASAILGVSEHVLLRWVVILACLMLLKFRLLCSLGSEDFCIWIDDATMWYCI